MEQAIADSMKKDGITIEIMNSLTEDERTKLTMSYMQAQIKKTEQMQTLYKTNTQFRDGFRRSVISLCK